MKKRKLLIFGACLSFFVFSCSYELEDPPSFVAGPLTNFGIADARLYFEENATDLSLLHFTEPHPSTRTTEETPELIPDWSEAVRTESPEAALIELPVSSASSRISVVRYFEKGLFCFSKIGESRVRLVVARRKDGSTQMFVVTLVPSAKYPNKKEDIENFRYLGGGNFTGKVFCSTLEGHFVEASQYVKGRFVGKLEVMTRRELEEQKVSLEEASYESIFLASSVAKTRSSTYSFSEGGGTVTPCPYHPPYVQGSCPFCLEEVIVLACRYCGARLEKGEVCHCRDCHYCHRYPCVCASDCSICRPYPCTKCTKCGRHYCFGECEITGGDNTGGGGGNSGNTNPPGSSETGIAAIKPLYAETSTLDSQQKTLLNTAMTDFIERSEKFKRMYDNLLAKGVKIKFEINPGKLEAGQGRASYLNNTITFYSEEHIHLNYLQEELIHAVQDLDIYGQSYMFSARKNIEFEAKVIQDIVTEIEGHGAIMGNMGQSPDFFGNYRKWIEEYMKKGCNSIISRFHEFCEPWTGYIGTYKSDFSPETIVKYF